MPGDYDYASARKAGLFPDKTGHWPSRVPSGENEGLILKDYRHPTFDLTIKGEQAEGNAFIERMGRLYSFGKNDPRIAGGSPVDLTLREALKRKAKNRAQ